MKLMLFYRCVYVLFGTSSKTINFINTSNKIVLLAFNDDFMRFRKRTKNEDNIAMRMRMTDKIKRPFSTRNISCAIFQQGVIGVCHIYSSFLVLWPRTEFNFWTKMVVSGVFFDKVLVFPKGQYPLDYFDDNNNKWDRGKRFSSFYLRAVVTLFCAEFNISKKIAHSENFYTTNIKNEPLFLIFEKNLVCVEELQWW